MVRVQAWVKGLEGEGQVPRPWVSKRQPVSKDVTSVDYLACDKDYQGKGVGSALAQSLNGP